MAARSDARRTVRRRQSDVAVVSAAVLAPLAFASAYSGGCVSCALAVAAVGILWEWMCWSRRASARSRGWLARACGIAADRSWPRRHRGGVGDRCWRQCCGALHASTDDAHALGGRRGDLCRRSFPQPGSAAPRRRMGFHRAAVPVRTVWATDIVAYFIGRALGGPLLWPRVSPKKTWSGASAACRGDCGWRRGRICERDRQSGGGRRSGAVAFGPVAGRRSVRIRDQAALRRQGRQPTHSRAMAGVMDRLDGFLVAAFAAARRSASCGKVGCPGARLAAMVSR